MMKPNLNCLLFAFVFFLFPSTGTCQDISLHDNKTMEKNGIPAAFPKSNYGALPIAIAEADIEIIRKRIISDLLEGPINISQMNELVKTIRPDGSWPGINYEDVSRTGFQHSRHLEHMYELGRALKKPGTSLYLNPEVKRVDSLALEFWIAHDFICENWWWNEMGTPNLMINTMLLLDDDLTDKQKKEGARIANRANLEASGARPGGDLIQIAGMLGKQGLFARDEATVARVVKVMGEEIKISVGRGMKPDMSFHHRVDNVISTLTYGTGYANAFSYWAVKTSGTKYSLPEPSMKLLIDYYLDGICKSLIYAMYPDPGAMNRDLSRREALEAVSSRIPENLIQASTYRKAELEEVVKIRKGEIKPNLTSNTFFRYSSYFTHQRPGYFASVRMHSSRNFNMEQPHNEEGLKNHHFADGSTFISVSGREYVNIFPVWDWQKIPGATIVQKPALPHWNEIPKKGLTDFSGGVSDGKYGVAAFDFASPHDPLSARKSWFFFDKEYVCLGASITSASEYPVVTTMNQCLLNTDVLVKRNGKMEKLDTGIHKLNKISWVLQDGVAYIFPTATDVSLGNKMASGNWRQINHQAWATEETVSKNVFSLWVSHGVKPNNASYAYFVVPVMKASAVDAYIKKKDMQILSNTAALQAVSHKGLARTEAVFYKAGNLNLGDGIRLGVNEPCILMISLKGKSITEIAIADPTQKLKTIQVIVNTPVKASGPGWKASPDLTKKSGIIQIDLPQETEAGKTVVMLFGSKN